MLGLSSVFLGISDLKKPNGIKLVFVFIFAAILLVSCNSISMSEHESTIAINTTKSDFGGSDDFLIYNLILDEISNGKKVGEVFVAEKTKLYSAVEKEMGQSLTLILESPEIKSLDRALLKNFTGKTESKNLTNQDLNCKVSTCEVLNNFEVEEFLKSDDRSEKLRENHPNLKSLITFSEIGYSSDRNEALMIVEIRQGEKSGTGYIFHLKKKGNKWAKADEIELWNS